MAINGIVTSDRLQDKLFQREIIQEILIASQGYGSLNNEALIRRASFKGTKVSLTTMDSVTVSADLAELEGADVKTQEFGSITKDLKADEVKVAFTDEALANATIDNPMQLAMTDASRGFARTLDKKIAEALNTTPMTGTAINVASKSFLFAAAEAAGKLGDYRMTGIAVGPTAAGNIFASLSSGSTNSNGYEIRDGLSYLPGYNVPIIVNSYLDTLASGYAYFVSTEVPAAFVFEGQYKTRVYDDPAHRAQIFQADVWNGVLSNIRQSNNTNMGVVKTQITTA